MVTWQSREVQEGVSPIMPCGPRLSGKVSRFTYHDRPGVGKHYIGSVGRPTGSLSASLKKSPASWVGVCGLMSVFKKMMPASWVG